MKRSETIFSAALAAAVCGAPAAAHEYTVGDLVIAHPWTRASPPGAGVAAGYAVIRNHGETPDALIGGSFDASERVEIHKMAMVDDVMRMRALASGIAIAPGEAVALRPGGLHLMFIGLSAQLKDGETVAGVMEFERAGRVDVVFTVEALGGRGDARGDQGGAAMVDHHSHTHRHRYRHEPEDEHGQDRRRGHGHGHGHSHRHGQ